MTKKNEVYKCSICGNVIEVIVIGGGPLVCCGKPMNLQTENTEDAAEEKHVPVVETSGDKVTVKVGSVEHPMEKEHYIQFIELLDENGIVAFTELKPGDKPIAEFCVEKTDGLYAREYCNLHGLWKS